jgi:hypothetical protein
MSGASSFSLSFVATTYKELLSIDTSREGLLKSLGERSKGSESHYKALSSAGVLGRVVSTCKVWTISFCLAICELFMGFLIVLNFLESETISGEISTDCLALRY